MEIRIFKLRSALYWKGKKIYSMDHINPFLGIKRYGDGNINFYSGCPISFVWELAGKGVPFFDETETELKLPFIVEVWNEVIIPENMIIKELATIPRRIFREKMKITKYLSNETDPEILSFREREKNRWKEILLRLSLCYFPTLNK